MKEKKVSLMDFRGNPNIGIYMFANDKFCILGPQVEEKKKKEIEDSLSVPVYNLTVLGTELVGIFIAGNNEYLLVPQMHDYEIAKLTEICDKHNMKIIELSTRLNTLGNNICISNDKILLSSEYDDKFEQHLKTQLKLKILKISSDKFKAIGSTFKCLSDKYFISHEYKESEVKQIIKNIAGVGTVNSGSSYISSGIIGNKFGIIIGSASTTVEIQNIIENLDYL